MERHVIIRMDCPKMNSRSFDLDDGRTFCMLGSTVAKYDLKQGSIVTDETLSEMLKTDTERRVLNSLLHKIDCTARPEKEYEVRLRREFSDEEAIKKAMQYAREHRFFDDDGFARNYYEKYKNKKSVTAIRNELRGRGISPSSIAFLSEIRDDREKLLEYAKKIVGTREKTPELRLKLLRRLASKGYSAEDSYSVANEIFSDVDD